MDSFVFFYKNRPGGESRFKTLFGLVSAAIAGGMRVSVFLDLDSIFASSSYQQSYESLELPKDKISEMIDMGAEIYVCSVCAAIRGLADPDDHVKGVRMISPERTAEMIAGKAACVSL